MDGARARPRPAGWHEGSGPRRGRLHDPVQGRSDQEMTVSRLGLILTRLALLALALGAWEVLPRIGWVNSDMLPPLSEVLAMLVNVLGRPNVQEAILVSGAEFLIAF